MDEELNEFTVEPFYGINGEELALTDFISVDLLQKIQDGFSDLTGCAALTTDIHGTAVTEGSNFTDFCTVYTRNSLLGKKRCEQCDKNGAIMTHKIGHPCSYECHAGLIDFAAPIMANGKMIGSFIGGQVLTEPFDEGKIGSIADELGIDREKYIEAIKRVPIVSRKTVEKATYFLYTVASILSTIAYSAYTVHEANIQLEHAIRAKSDFLANMSHEIRTPMNAVLGMAELALREDMSTDARNYIYQIKASGKNLLVIINDILDFSKIESGKMDIVPASYEPLSLINDVANIVCSRLTDNKNIEFVMDISPDIPSKLFGDNVRIQQIMINLLGNAVKFTKKDEVKLKLYAESIKEQDVMLYGEISDTGIGIKPENMDKLFKSFQQVDSKRNRNIEGTGLGLAITSKLLELMGGGIEVSSVYGKGTTFKFHIPQKAMNNFPLMTEDPEKVFTVDLLITNKYVKKQIMRELDRIDAVYNDITDISGYKIDEDFGDKDFLITEAPLYTEKMNRFFSNSNSAKCIVIEKTNSSESIINPNVSMVRKPVYFLNLFAAMGVINEYVREGEKDTKALSFIAPDANVLIVDDNPVNLTVACGLLAPLKMKIDTADSCATTMPLAQKKVYDIVFMDHMMPEVDGIETAHKMRNEIPNYTEVPIIALTANALEGTREMFLKEGFNDFVTKPIDIKVITATIHKWLPEDKIIPVEADSASDKDDEDELYIEGLDIDTAVARLGSRSLFMTVLRDYYLAIDKRADTIKTCFENEQWHEYTIEVHSLKSTSRQVGADELSVLAYELELAGKNNSIDVIKEKTSLLLNMYLGLKENLEPHFPDSTAEKVKHAADMTVIMECLDNVIEAINSFDTLLIDKAVEKLDEYQFDTVYQNFFKRLSDAAEACDLETCANIAEEWRTDIASSFINR